MKLIVKLKLQPTEKQARALLQTLETANAAANAISRIAWARGVFGQFKLHKESYHPIRAQFDLTAQMVVRLNAKVAHAYKLDRNKLRIFRPHGSIAYDDRILRYSDAAVSIWTVKGRLSIPFVCGERQRALLASRQGESDLVYCDGFWYLLATVNYEEPPEGEVLDVLGVDLGIVNIATDSDGNVYSGARVNSLRHRHRRLRKKLSRKFTSSARRLSNRRKRKERRFAAHVNHCISKKIVAEAQRTKRAIALEELTGIRTRVRARKPQRATLSSWSFAQLGSFIAYKAQMDGVQVLFVDPRHSSRTCPGCDLVDKRNRTDQATFCCVSCGLAGHADHFAAVILADRGRAVVSQPHADAVGSASSTLFRDGGTARRVVMPAPSGVG